MRAEFSDTRSHITQPGKISRGSLRQRHSARSSTAPFPTGRSSTSTDYAT
jgi:hypothetical protein